MPDAIAEQLAYQQGGIIPARMPGTEHPTHKRTGDPRPLHPPGKRHALPNHQPSHRAPAFPAAVTRDHAGRTDTRGCTPDSAACVKSGHAASPNYR
jgi:hypothetical protein